MIEFGKTLREAREAKGLSISQLAEQTRILHQIIEGLEVENFTRIVAPIYGRGFVKLYCEAVGLDPKPMVAEFMDLYTGNRTAAIRMRAVEQPSAPPTASAEPDPPRATYATDGAEEMPQTEMSQSPVTAHTPAPTAFPEEDSPTVPFASADLSEADAQTEPVNEPKREYRLPGRSLETARPALPPNLWRLAALGVGVLVVLWLLIAGIRAVYHATMIPAEEEDAKPAPKTAESAKPAPKQEAKKAAPKQEAKKPAARSERKARTATAVPSLYID